MTSNHADYCPISIGVEVLGDRWTPLVIRELMVGAHGFNDIHRGIPRISRTLLAQRLRHLERIGLVERTAAAPGKAGRYELTEAGNAITPVVWAMGHWAAEWVFGEPNADDLDGLSLIWRLHQHAIPDKLPTTRTIVHVVLTGTNGAAGWLELGPAGASVCKEDQGYDVDLAIEADTTQMHRWIAGVVPFRQLVADGHARLLGPSRLARAFPTWFNVSTFADDLGRARRRRKENDALARVRT